MLRPRKHCDIFAFNAFILARLEYSFYWLFVVFGLIGIDGRKFIITANNDNNKANAVAAEYETLNKIYLYKYIRY